MSKITVRNAIKELVQEGYVEKKSGKGTKVIRILHCQSFQRESDLQKLLVEEGHYSIKKVLKAEVG